MKRCIFVLMIPLIICSCSTFRNIKPAGEKVNYKVDSLQPTLEWESFPGADSYDLIIYNGYFIQDSNGFPEERVGKEIYFRKGLKGTSHKVEIVLQPSSKYYWTIRARQGNKVTIWSKYDNGGSINNLFRFVTPKK